MAEFFCMSSKDFIFNNTKKGNLLVELPVSSQYFNKMAPNSNELNRDSSSSSINKASSNNNENGNVSCFDTMDADDICCHPFLGQSTDESGHRQGFAMDAVVMTTLKEEDKKEKSERTEELLFASSEFHVQFPGTVVGDVKVEINGQTIDELRMKASKDGYFVFVETGTRIPPAHVLQRLYLEDESFFWGNNSLRFLLLRDDSANSGNLTSSMRDLFASGTSSLSGSSRMLKRSPPTEGTGGSFDTTSSSSSQQQDTSVRPRRNSLLGAMASVRRNSFHGSSSRSYANLSDYNHDTSFREEPARNIFAIAEARLFLWSTHDLFAVSDIDGTVTKSDVQGVFDSVFTERYKCVHRGICQLFTNMSNRRFSSKKVRFVYLTARPIRLAPITRKFLSDMTQEVKSSNHDTPDEKEKQQYSLPPGPLFCHPGSMANVLTMELIHKNTYDFKTGTIVDQIYKPYRTLSPSSDDNHDNPFIAGFGNKETDHKAYIDAGMKDEQIYIINKSGNIIQNLSPNLIKLATDNTTTTRATTQRSFTTQDDNDFISDMDEIDHSSFKQKNKKKSRFPDFSQMFTACSPRTKRPTTPSKAITKQTLIDFKDPTHMTSSMIAIPKTKTKHKYRGYDDPQLFELICQLNQ